MRSELDPTSIINTAQDAMVWAFHNTAVIGVLAFAIILMLIVRAVRAARPYELDPQRMFSTSQKAEAKRRAGGRCEHSFMGLRCRRPGEHADHIWPHSRGGATAMSNCQSLCAPHNLSKSNKIPSRYYISRLAVRRRRYFPDTAPAAVEWHLGLAK